MKRWRYTLGTERDHIAPGSAKRAGVGALELSRAWEMLGHWRVRLIVAWGTILWSSRVYLASVIGVSHPIIYIRQAALPGPLGDLLRWLRNHATDVWWVAMLAVALSISSFAWYDAHGYTVAFNDARIRAMISRRVVASNTPGLAQLGVTWLPLEFILELPVIWNDTLFRNGIAASFPSMLAFALAAVYLYRTALLLTASRWAGWVAATVLFLNPSLLYMQSTAMSETGSVCALVVSTYYALRLAQTYSAVDIVKCATAVAAGTLIRYENWALAIVFVPVIVYVAWRHKGYALAEAWAILYSFLAFAGCIAWMIYNGVIFHDPFLSFFYGNSNHTYYAGATAAELPARHNVWVAFETYGYTVAQTVGWVILVTGFLGLLAFILRMRLRSATLSAYLLLVPFAFYWLVLYLGVNTENLPELGTGRYYNIRFGLMMIPASALFTAFFVASLAPIKQLKLKRLLAPGALMVIALISIIGSTVQTPFVLSEALYGAGSEGRLVGQEQAQWLNEHYRGGDVLITYVNDPSMMFFLLTEYDFSDRALITDANGWQFDRALAHPETTVTWIIMDSDATNGASRIWLDLTNRQDWRNFFVLRKTIGTTQMYEYVGAQGTGGVSSRPAMAIPGQRRMSALLAHDFRVFNICSK